MEGEVTRLAVVGSMVFIIANARRIYRKKTVLNPGVNAGERRKQPFSKAPKRNKRDVSNGQMEQA